MPERLQKYLADSGLGSRRYCEDLIIRKEILVNGEIAKIGATVSSNDKIEFQGNQIQKKTEEIKIVMLNKPEGYISSMKKNEHKRTVFDLLPKRYSRNWISIGRLDLNSSGLMLFTNDGKFANKCMHPSSKIDKEYILRGRGVFNEEIKRKMIDGIMIDGKKHKLSDIVEGRQSKTNRWFTVCLFTGRNREIRKIFGHFNIQISRLKRVRIGNIFLPSSLKAGKHKLLDENQINSLVNYIEDAK